MQILGSDPVLAVHDLTLAADWFVRVLGCEKSEPDPGNWTFCSAGNVTFMLGRSADADPARDAGDRSYIAYLTVDCVDDYYARSVAQQAEVVKPLTDEPWGRREFGLRTVDGYRIMLSERLPAGADTTTG